MTMTQEDRAELLAEIVGVWKETPTAKKEDVELVLEFLLLVHGLDHVQAAEELGIKEPTVRRWRRGGIRPLQKEMRKNLRRYVDARTKPQRLAGEAAEEDRATTTVLDPNTARRAIGAVPPSDVKTRVAIIRDFESAWIENGVPPGRWPAWFEELRESVYGKM